MLTKTQYLILDAFRKNTFASITTKQIAQHCNSNSKSLISGNLLDLEQKHLLKRTSIGNVNMYSLELENSLLFPLLQLLSWNALPKQIYRTIQFLISKLESQKIVCSIVLFGSYAKHSFKKNSDIDILFLVKDTSQNEELYAVISETNLHSVIELDTHIICVDEYLEMLLNDEENLGKEIARNNLPIYAVETFYMVQKLGVKHGFKL